MPKINLIYLCICVFLFNTPLELNSQARPDLSELKKDIINASTEQERIEGIIRVGSAYSNMRLDSADYYYELLESEEYSNSELAISGKNFLNGMAFYRSRQYDSAIANLVLSAEIFEENVKPNLYLNNLNMLGIAYNQSGKSNESILIFKKLIEKAKELEINNYLTSSYANMANAYKRQRKFADAIYYSEQSIAFATSDKMTASSIFAYMNIAQMLSMLELYERSVTTFDIALNLELKNGQQVKMTLFSGKAKSLRRLGKLDSAILNFEKAIEIGEKNLLNHLLMGPNMELAGVYLEKGDLEKAHESVNSALEYCGEKCPPPAQIQLYIHRMRIAQAEKNYDEAIKLSTEFETLINQQQLGHLSKEGFQIVSSVYEEIGDTDNGLKYQKLYNELNFGSIAFAQRARIAKERLRLDVLESQAALEEEQSNTAFYKSVTFQVAIFAVILIFGLVVLYRYYKREKQEGSLKADELEALKEQLTQLSDLKLEFNFDFITLKSKAVIDLNKLKYIKSDGPYLELFLSDKQNPEIDRNTLKHILVELPSHRFIQVHRSSIVNLGYVKAVYSNKLVLKDGKELSISRSFKSEVESLLKATA